MSEEETPVHKRRVRYHGKNPVKFEDRYKEHDPQKYADDVEHIIAKGQTPAGMHLPICVEEILQILDPKPGEVVLDATLGYGGHSQRLMPLVLPDGLLFATDVDRLELPRAEERMRQLGYDEVTFMARPLNFSKIRALLPESGGGFDCILADLGVSSMQLDNPARGFTYKSDGPLDLRLDPTQGKPASELLKAVSLLRLEKILIEYADEPNARDIARAILGGLRRPATTMQLVEAVKAGLKNVTPRLYAEDVKKTLARVFMALRIAVNEELSVLDRFLDVVPECLKEGGRVAILSFHSGEDRRVKKAFALGFEFGYYTRVAPAPVMASEEERRSNPRSASAKLRWAIRSDKPFNGF